jgi:hypothetical protein
LFLSDSQIKTCVTLENVEDRHRRVNVGAGYDRTRRRNKTLPIMAAPTNHAIMRACRCASGPRVDGNVTAPLFSIARSTSAENFRSPDDRRAFDFEFDFNSLAQLSKSSATRYLLRG